MHRESQLLQVIEEIYEAAADGDRFPKLADVIARQFDTESTFLYLCAQPSGEDVDFILGATANFDRWARSSYNEYYHQRDEWFSHTNKSRLPQIVIGRELVDDSTLLRSEWYADYCRRLDAFHLLGTMFSVDGALGVIGIHRPTTSKEFNDKDKRALGVLMPHLQRAFQIHHRLSAADRERGFASEILDRLGLGVILVGRRSKVIFANRVAERVLQSGDALVTSHGRLRPRNPQLASKLENIIREAVLTSAGKGTGAAGVISISGRFENPLSVLVSPLRSQAAGFGPPTPAALVVFADPASARTISSEALARVYGLTPAQARLLAALLAGTSLSEYARAAGISINTANTHLDHIFAKTGHHRQSDLIRMVATDPVLKLS